MEIIGVIIAGIIIGLLGKLVAPSGRDNVGFVVTVLCGIAGVIVGWYVATALGVASTAGVDWARWLISIVVAAVFVVVATALTGRTSARSRL